MFYPSAYLLVSHGSHDPRPQAVIDRLAERFAQKMRHAGWQDWGSTDASSAIAAPSHLNAIVQPPTDGSVDRGPQNQSVAHTQWVGTACLECRDQPLHTQIEQFSRSWQMVPSATGAAHKLVVLPLFLLSGVHVMEDIPQQIALAQAALGSTVAIETRPAIGSHPKLSRLVTECMAAQPVEAWILLSHGSRRPGANQSMDAMAERLGAIAAYWSVPPNLESRLQALIPLGIRSVGILPYFLFPGATTDAIAQTVAALSQQFPTLQLHLAPPLSASSELTDLLVDLAQD